MPKGKAKDTSTKAQIVHRLKIAKGHLEKVIQMTEGDEYCIDIVHQSLAVSAALKKANDLVLENHLRTCVAESLGTSGEKQIIDEVMAIIKKS